MADVLFGTYRRRERRDEVSHKYVSSNETILAVCDLIIGGIPE